MTHLPRAPRTALLGTTLAVAALAAAIPSAVAVASAKTASDSSPKLALHELDGNAATLYLTNAPKNLSNQPVFGAPASVFNGRTRMAPLSPGTESANLMGIGGLVHLYDLTRGARYSISVKFTDPNTGHVKTSNAVKFTTPASTDTQPPTTPTNLRFVPADDAAHPNSRCLKFGDSTDNADHGNLQYVIMRHGDPDRACGEFYKGEGFEVIAIDSSSNASDPARIVYDGK